MTSGSRQDPRQDLTQHLLEDISSQRLAPGAKLPPERVLAERFGLSRPIVREVLRRLQERNLVDILPARGTIVRSPSTIDEGRSLDSFYRRSRATARQVTEARLMLEVEAARLAARRATEEELAGLTACVDAFDASEHPLERARHDIAFHARLARSSHNVVVETMYASLARLAFELMLRSLSDPDILAAGAPYHRQILDAVRSREPEQAAQAMREHLSLAQKMFGADFDRDVADIAHQEIERVSGPGVSLPDLLDDIFG